MRKLSDQTRLDSLSEATGIDVYELRQLLDGTARTLDQRFIKKTQSEPRPTLKPEPQRRVTMPTIRQKSMIEEIDETEEISELWSILSRLTYDQPEFIICYEKLIKQVNDYEEIDDIEELEALIKELPDGSPEQDALVAKAKKIEMSEIENEDDFSELIDIYNERSIYSDSRKLLVQKLLDTARDPEDASKLLDEVFDADSAEYYLAKERHSEIVIEAIKNMKVVEDSDEIAPHVYVGSKEEILLAKKIVEIGNDSDDILSREEDFKTDSEAHETIVLGAIEKFDDYENDQEALDRLIGNWSEGSRVEKAAKAKKRTLLVAHAATLTDTDEMQELLSEFEDGDIEKKNLQDRIINGIDDLDELHNLANEDGGYLERMAREKLDHLILERIAKYNPNSDDDIEDYIESDTDEEMALAMKRVELCTSKDDADDIADNLPANSYAMYLLAKKFTKGTPTKNVAPTIEMIEDIVDANNQSEDLAAKKEEEEEAIRVEEMRKKISRNTVLKTAIEIYNSLQWDDVNKEAAYNKAAELLNNKLAYIRSEKDALELLKAFPEDTTGSGKILQKLAEYYKKPFWQFW